MMAKKYRNTVTFSHRNSARIRLRQKHASFSRTVNEDLSNYYDLIDCMTFKMKHFFSQPRKWQYYCESIRAVEIYKRKHAIAFAIRMQDGSFKPWSCASDIAWALEEGARKRLDVIWRVDGKALAQEARTLDIAQAVWVYDRVIKYIEWRDINGKTKKKSP